jgi:hypothetical protein
MSGAELGKGQLAVAWLCATLRISTLGLARKRASPGIRD